LRRVPAGSGWAADFLPTLQASIARFNGFAGAGRDEDFGRGDTTIQLVFNGPIKEEPGRTNPTMWPLADSGPYYAALVTGGTLDTKGGPRTTPGGQAARSCATRWRCSRRCSTTPRSAGRSRT
jgi:hypothetical protein